jgi:thioredoxin 1
MRRVAVLARRTFVALILMALPALATHGLAADRQAFTPAAFAAAQQAGKSILVDIRADWCPTCKAQDRIIDKLAGEPQYRNVVIFAVDFDTQKDVIRKFRAQLQSTLIGFKGPKETRRSTGDTDPLSIEDLLESTL